MRLAVAIYCALLPGVMLLEAPTLHAGAVAEWNEIALEKLSAAEVNLLELERTMALLQMAVYEASNATEPTYAESKLAVAKAPGASMDAAVTEAAYRVLTALTPVVSADVLKERDRRLALIADSPQKQAGIAAGMAAANAVVESRLNDGADFSAEYTPGTGDGAYLPTSGSPMAGPRVGKMKPFCFTSFEQYLPPPPPPLDSAQMRRDLVEVAEWGGKDSTLRTADQTEFAIFHGRPGIYAWNSIARQAAQAHHMSEVESAHLLSVLNMGVVDSHFALFQAKYVYNLWRPVTAIRAGGGPLKLKPSADWTPLISTPMIPEYPCAHCGLGTAMQTILEGSVGSGPIDLTVKNGKVVRHYHSFRQYAEEESLSRIYAGVHYRWSKYVGESMGSQIGEAELAEAPKPLATR